MREQLNNNPMAQMGAVAVLLVVGAIFLLTTMGGGGEEEGSEAGEVTATVNGAAATGETPGEAVEGAVESLETAEAPPVSPTVPVPPIAPPDQVVDAWESGATVVLLFVREGGIDDRLMEGAAGALAGFPNAVSFVVPAKEISRYSAVTSGVGVERVPALVVLTPKRLDQGIPTASVLYGYQSPESIVQAVIDAGYKGPTLDYHP
jgi:hypothetical protein